MGTRKRREKQRDLWVATSAIVRTPANAFYDKLNEFLGEHRFDRAVEGLCRRYCKGPRGRPSMAPGIYFRPLLTGYFERLGSERGIAWRVADSLSLRRFIGYTLAEPTPDHSTVSRTRRLLALETHKAVFRRVLQILSVCGGYRRADARATGLVRPETQEEGLQPASNEEWQSPHDPDARITKMKDGRTHLAHKAEHAVHLSSGAVLAVTMQPANCGDTTTIRNTVAEAGSHASLVSGAGIEEIVADKGYHSGEVLMW